jgi:hypothetical protein
MKCLAQIAENFRRRDDDELVEMIVVGVMIERFAISPANRSLAMWCQSTSSTALRAVPTLETERPGRAVPCSRVAGLSCCRICSTSSLTWCAVPLLRRKSAFWPSPIRTSALWEIGGSIHLSLFDASMWANAPIAAWLPLRR